MEFLHSIADIAVVAAVVVGGSALLLQARDRQERRAAVDAYIRTLASQARRELRQARNGVKVTELAGRISTRGTLPGDLLATFFTSIAAQAPLASPPIRRAAPEVCELFWGTMSQVKDRLAGGGTIAADAATGLEKEVDRIEDLLNALSKSTTASTAVNSREGSHVTRQPTDDGRYALYDHAHHDVWWAKSQEWSVANWALLLIAGVVGVGIRLTPSADLKPEHTWPYVGLAMLVALCAGLYFSALHVEVVGLRKTYRALEKQTGIDLLRTQIPRRADEESDWRRGLRELTVMLVAITVATVFAIRLLGASWSLAVPLGGGVGIVNLAMVFGAALVCRYRQRQRRLTDDTHPSV